jgi:glycosyltransferase involved in cell wall biosynthesis
MRIAILGTRGVPASYGGFETFAEQLSTRLAARGHDVTVYCRSHYVSPRQLEYRGVRLKVLPTLATQVHGHGRSHIPLCAPRRAAPLRRRAHLQRRQRSLRHYHAPSRSRPSRLNVDGLEHKRRKWGWLGRSYYLLAERLATLLPNEIVTDARVIQDYYHEQYGVSSTMIAYGADVERRADKATVAQWGVVPDGYVLYVSRLEPENNAALVVEAFQKVRTDKKLLVVGDAPYARDYIERVRRLAATDARVIMPGFVFGEAYRALQQNAAAYIHATEVGGTHPALLEAMGYGNCVLTLATPENLETVGDAAIPYKDANELTARLQEVLTNKMTIAAYRRRAQQRILERYTWEQVVDEYERLLARLAGKELPQRLAAADYDRAAQSRTKAKVAAPR